MATRIGYKMDIPGKSQLYDALLKLSERTASGEDIMLVCCCKPKDCHGDILKEAIEKIVEHRYNKKRKNNEND